MTVHASLRQLRGRATSGLPGLLGIEIVEVDDGHLVSRVELRDELLAPNGYLHAGTVVTLADTSCGFGCFASLPANATGFTTIELKINFIATVKEGAIRCTATRAHRGRTTEVWDAAVTAEADGKVLAAFRCTQLILTR